MRPNRRRVAYPIAIAILVVALMSAWAKVGWTADGFTGDMGLASVSLLTDRSDTLSEKLGAPVCVVPDARTTIYQYRGAQGNYLEVEIASAKGDVDHELVVSLVMRAFPDHTAICATPATHGTHLLVTQEGLRLGDSIERVKSLYGQPNQERAEGNRVSWKYDRGSDSAHYFEWELEFLNGRLVTWILRSYPVFAEAAG